MSHTSDNLEFSRKLDDLRATDNTTNLFYIGRAWFLILVTMAGFVSFDLWRADTGLSIIWDIPLWITAVVIIGASQHQLAGGGHEGTHYTLFRNRTMNELLSDWVCMFPILTSTAIYRKQHLAHHKHVNDPEKDPDLAQLHASKHEFDFPLRPREVFVLFLRQLWFPNLIRYTLGRARYSAIGIDRGISNQPTADVLFFPYAIALFITLGLLAHFEVHHLCFYLATAVLAAGTWFAKQWLEKGEKPASTKSRAERDSRGRGPRFVHVTILFLSLTLLHVYTGYESLVYFIALWLIPLITSFSYFMMLRQTIQHGNCDDGRFNNTRVFLVNPLLRYAVFPFGMDYHLPHHLYATVPHYRLRELHELLAELPSYRQPGFITEGVFTSPARNESSQHPPSLLAALGPEFSPRRNRKSQKESTPP